MDTDTWLHSAPCTAMPPCAVLGGHDCDGSPLYVGRAFHEGDTLPAKVVPSKGTAYVSWGGQVIPKAHYEVLVGQNYSWQRCHGGAVPPNAVRAGNTLSAETLYVGRGSFAGSLTPGKIHPSHGCLYIPFGGQEVRITTYEVLVREAVHNWVASTPNNAPPGAVEGGISNDGATIYVGRAMHEGEMLPAKVIPRVNYASVCYGGDEISKNQIEVLTGHGYAWMKPHNHSIPPNAVSTGRSRNGEPLFVGRGLYLGSVNPGVVSVSERCLYVPSGYRARRVDSYEVLIKL